MTTYRKVRKLSPEEAAYIAGLIDGEGSISLTRKHRGDNRQLVVSISNTDADLLGFVRKTIDAGRITRKRTSRGHHTPGLAYALDNRQALDLLEQVAPYLLTYKSLRAELVLQHYIRLTPRNGKYTAALLRERDNFVEEFLSLNPRRTSSI
jgi:hypothetical protein